MKQIYGEDKKKENQKPLIKHNLTQEKEAEADLIKLKKSLSPKIPITLNQKDKDSTDYEEVSIKGLNGGKYSTINVVNFESAQPSRQNSDIVGGEFIINSLKNSIKAGKDRYQASTVL